MDGRGVKGSLRHVGLEDVAPIQHRGLRLGGGVQRGDEAPLVECEGHERIELVPLHPRLEGPESGGRRGPLRCLHERIPRGDQGLELGPLVGPASSFLLPDGFTATQDEPPGAVDHFIDVRGTPLHA